LTRQNNLLAQWHLTNVHSQNHDIFLLTYHSIVLIISLRLPLNLFQYLKYLLRTMLLVFLLLLAYLKPPFFDSAYIYSKKILCFSACYFNLNRQHLWLLVELSHSCISDVLIRLIWLSSSV